MRGLSRFLLIAVAAIAAFASTASAQHIVIDPGHGGTDPGGTGNGLEEKDIVLDVSQRFRDLLVADTADAAGGGTWSVSLTRDTDVFISLAARSDYANSVGADRFMSIHSNAFGNTTANGTETFSYSNGTMSASLRDLVQEEMIAAWGLTNRGNKTASFAVLRNTSMPAVLHELGFVTNSTDAAKLGDPLARQDAAEAHLRALQRNYGITPYIPGATSDAATAGIDVVVTNSGGPLANAVITINGDEQGYTDLDGLLEIRGVAAGSVLLGVSAAGHDPLDQIVNTTAGDVALVEVELIPAPIDMDPGFDQPIEGGPCVSGRDCGDEDPVSSFGCSATGHSGTLASLVVVFVLLSLRRKREEATVRFLPQRR